MTGRNGAALVVTVVLATAALAEGGGMAQSGSEGKGSEKRESVSALLLLDDEYGANFLIDDGIPSILERFREYGWKITTAAVRKEVRPCAWGVRNAGQKPFTPDLLVSEIGDAAEFDLIVLLPGKSQDNLYGNPETLALLRRAARAGTVVAAWCRSGRILARAGVLDGVHVVGRPEYRAEFLAAGAFPAEVPSLAEAPPPISDRGIVTTLRSKHYGTAMCEEIRKTVFASVPELAFGRKPPKDPARSLSVAFFVREGQETEARILVASLRTFGGALRDVPVRILHPADSPLLEGPDRSALEGLGVRFVPFLGDPKVMSFPLSAKVAAAAEAERLAEGESDVLAWLDVDTVFLSEPTEFLLPAGISLALRPVHHRLIGSPFDEPPSSLWRRLYDEERVSPENAFPMVTTIDRQKIRPYFNAGCLALRPDRRILRTWYSELARLIRDPSLTEEAARVSGGTLFLHQAVLSAVILSRVPGDQILELPFRYNYPLALHRGCPVDLRPASWNVLSTLRYDSLQSVLGTAWRSLPADGALAVWLEERFGR